MAWGGIIFRAPAGTSIGDLPADFQLSILGTTVEIGKLLRSLFPDGEHGQGECSIRGDDFWLELTFLDMDDAGDCNSIGVRCNAGLGVIPVLQRVCQACGARLFDNQMGEFSDLEGDLQSSMCNFSAWRDRVLDEAKRDPGPA